MKRLLIIPVVLLFFAACSNKKKEDSVVKDTRIMLRGDTINTIKMTDTMIIYESTCRGCAYQETTGFALVDSLGIVQLDKVITNDNNPEGMEGGSISKDIIIVPLKTGMTTIKVIKTWRHDMDSSHDLPPIVSSYTIDVRN